MTDPLIEVYDSTRCHVSLDSHKKLIRKHFTARSALEFGQSVFYRNSLGFIVDMERWFKGEILQNRSVDIHKPHFRVIRHQMPSTLSAKFSISVLRLVEGT